MLRLWYMRAISVRWTCLAGSLTYGIDIVQMICVCFITKWIKMKILNIKKQTKKNSKQNWIWNLLLMMLPLFIQVLEKDILGGLVFYFLAFGFGFLLTFTRFLDYKCQKDNLIYLKLKWNLLITFDVMFFIIWLVVS